MSKTFVLMGCGGHARSVADAILSDHAGARIIFVDGNARPGEKILGFDAVKSLADENAVLIPAAGDNARRKDECLGIKMTSYVSSAAHVGVCARIGNGCFVGIGAHVGPESFIGNGTIVNTNAVVEHNAEVGEFCHIAPNATVCGGCAIGNLVLVGAGSVIKPYCKICSNVVIGAGTVVVKDITESGTYVGSPARKVA